MIDKNQVLLLAEERVNELNKGLYIVDLTISPSNSIYVEIDNENGPVAIADCISISRNIEHSLDRESMDFELQVSSAGLDRPLKHEKQFKKSIGKKVSILLVSGLEVEGTLSHCDEKVLHLAKEIVSPNDKSKKVKGIENIALEREQIKEVKRLVTFK